MDLVPWIGGLASVASTASFAPQAWKIIRTRDTTSISLGMYWLTVVGFALWLSFGYLLGQWPLIVTNAICLAFSAFILTMKLLPEKFKHEVANALDPSVNGGRIPGQCGGVKAGHRWRGRDE